MGASTTIVDYLGHGNISARPTTPVLAAGVVGLYWADDESKLYAWNGTSWSLTGAATDTVYVANGGNGANSSSAYAFKGNIFTPSVNMKLYGIGANLLTVNGATYKGLVGPLSGLGPSGVTLSATPNMTAASVASGAVQQTLYAAFASPISLTAGTVYGLMWGRTDGGDTYGLPVRDTTLSSAIPTLLPGSVGYFCRIAKAAPASGDSVDTSSGATDLISLGFKVSF